MELLVKKLWMPHDLDDMVNSLLQITPLRELFEEGYKYDGEMRPHRLKIVPGYWPAEAILARLTAPPEAVYLILTSLDLRGDFGRIYGRGRSRVAIASTNGFTNGHGVFRPDDVDFSATAFGEIGHALGLEHHPFDDSNPCEMSHNYHPGPHWKSLSNIRFCHDCYQKINE